MKIICCAGGWGQDELSFPQLKSNQRKQNMREMQVNCTRHEQKSINYPNLKRGNKAPIIKINRHSVFSDGLSDSNED